MVRAELAVLLALCVLPIVLAEPLEYMDCGSDKGTLLRVDVSPCPTQPCRMVIGKSYTINVTFRSKEDSDRCTAVVQGYLFNVALPLRIPEPDGCKSGISCPIKAGKTYRYSAKLPILSKYPAVALDVRWQLLDADGKTLVCWEIPGRIVRR